MFKPGIVGLLVVLALALSIAGLISFDLVPSTESARDWVIIIYGLMGILFFTLLVLFLLVIFWQLGNIRRAISELVDDSVRPTLGEVQRTAENVRGASEFIADTAVNPVIRIVSITRGVRRGISSITGIRSRRK